MDFKQFKLKYQKIEVEEVPNTCPFKPVVSVCVQTYQHRPFIRQCLDGLLNQETNFPFEIILGDDDSNDGTREICEDYAERNPEKIRLLLHKRENQIKIEEEPSGNFNAFYNFFSARGNYIAFCEGDDYWDDPLKLQKQVEFLSISSKYVLCYHEFRTIDHNGYIIHSSRENLQPKTDLTTTELSRGIHPALFTVCFKKVFDQIPEEIITVINVDTFLCSILGNYGKAKFLKNVKPAFYRKHKGGIWSFRNKEKKLMAKIYLNQNLKKFFFKLNKIGLADYYNKMEQNERKMLIVHHMKHLKFLSGSKILLSLLKRT